MKKLLTSEGFTNGLALLLSAHPKLKPEGSTRAFVLKSWHKMFQDISDEAFLDAVARFIMEHKDIYPGCSFIAHIREIAKPKLSETEGDCLELVFQAVSKFGYMCGNDALEWIRERSKLAAAVTKRIGWRELCTCENQEVLRGQMRSIFKTEKARSLQLGVVVESAVDLRDGLPKNDTLKIAEKFKDKLEKLQNKTSLKSGKYNE